MEEKIYCSHCGAIIEDDDYSTVNGQIYALTAFHVTAVLAIDVVLQSGIQTLMVMNTRISVSIAMIITILAVSPVKL